MIIREIIMWLSIMRHNLKDFPEVGSDNKIKALNEAIDIIHKHQLMQADYNARLKDDMAAMHDKPSGKWINIKDGRGGHLKGHECSFCHSYPPSYRNGGEYLSRYCPECGMRMESEVDNGDDD